jgi:CRP/FNR family transcriptional regulator, cyclic AMP receptor protein
MGAQATAILKQIPLFAGLDDADLELIAQASRRLTYPKGSVVFHEGDPGDYLVVILKGRVKVSLYGKDGQETILAIMKPSDFLGEVALLDGTPRSATATATTPLEVLRVGREPFVTMMRTRQEIALHVVRQLTTALRRATEQVRTLSMYDVYGRVLRCLLVTAQQQGQTSGPRMIVRPGPTVTELASMAGCSRETVSRALKVLVSGGYVTVVEGGFAVEHRAIREYLVPTLQNLPHPK